MSSDNGYVIRFNTKGEYVFQMYFASAGYPDIDNPNSHKFWSMAEALVHYAKIEAEDWPTEYGLTVYPTELWDHLTLGEPRPSKNQTPERGIMIDTKKYVRKPLYVEGVVVTAENMEEISAWCSGEVQVTEKTVSPTVSYIKVGVHRPLNERQTMAFVGDVVLLSSTGFKVYTWKAFQDNFVECDGAEADKATQTEKTQPVEN